MSRSKSVVINTVWEMGCHIAVILLGFLAPRFIIQTYGSEVNGLSSTITRILNIILLLQSGATTAAIFSLYKPVAENNAEEIRKNVAAAEGFFRKIAWIFFGMMLVVAAAAPFLIRSELPGLNVSVAFILMGIKSFIDLLFTAKFRVVFTAYQEKFLISISTLIEQAVYYVLLFLTVFAKAPYLLIYVWFLIGCVAKIVFLSAMFRKKHRDIETKQYRHVRLEIDSRNYALLNEVSHSLVTSSIAIILSIMYSLKETSVYSVYELVGQALSLVTAAVYTAFAPSFGNLAAGGQKEQASRVYGIFQYIYIILNIFLSMCMLFLLKPFVQIYKPENVNDIEYVNQLLAVLMVAHSLFSAFRIPYNILVSTLGYFRETWKQPVISAVLSIALSVALGKINYALVLVGPTVFYIINFVYQHIRLKKLVPWLIDDRRTVCLLAISLVGLGITFLLTGCITVPAGIVSFLCAGVAFAVGTAAFLFISSALVMRKELKQSLNYVRTLLSGPKRKTV